jgi:type I restriction enzyme S subunit
MKGEKKAALTPKLRFPEFREGPLWEEKPLSFVCDINPDSDDLPDSFVYIDLDSVDAGVLVTRKRIAKNGAPSRAQRLLKNGDVAFQIVRPYQQNNLFVQFDDTEAYVASTGYAQLRAHDSPAFLYQSVHADSFISRVITKCTGSSYPAINSSDLGDVLLPVPPSHAEQQKIADCLSSLDMLIAAHGQKLAALRAWKKGLMQQLFPHEGESLPRLRFREFRDAPAWRKCRISDLLKKVLFPIEVQAAETYREIGVRSHGKGVFHKEPVSGTSIAEKRVFRVVEDAFVVNIVFAWEQAVATTSKEEAGMIASHRFPMYVPNLGDCDVGFIKFTFLTPAGKHLLGLASPGGAGRNRTLGQTEFEKLEIVIPAKEEQTKIADVLDGIDDLIRLQNKIIIALRRHKKGLMQQLFPSLGRNRR